MESPSISKTVLRIAPRTSKHSGRSADQNGLSPSSNVYELEEPTSKVRTLSGKSMHRRSSSGDAVEGVKISFPLLLLFTQLALFIAMGLLTEYSGDVKGDQSSRETNSPIDLFHPYFADVHVMIFIGFGLLYTFVSDYSFSSIGMNLWMGSVAFQWGILTNGVLRNVNTHTWAMNYIQLDITSIIGGDFAAGFILVSLGCVLGKLGAVQSVVMVFIGVPFYSLNQFICLDVIGGLDVGGSIVVHLFGAVFGSVIAWILRHPNQRGNSAQSSTRSSDVFALIGSLLLFVYWPSFNAALVLQAQRHRVVLNTVIALSASVVSAIGMSSLTRPHYRLDIVDLQNAILAGGVTVGCNADLLQGPASAGLTGIIAGATVVLGFVYLQPWTENTFDLHDTAGAQVLHGLCGLLGGCISVPLLMTSTSGQYGASAKLLFGHRGLSQVAFQQILIICTTFGIGIIAGLVTGGVLKLIGSPQAKKSMYNDAVLFATHES